jgi:hypothetical protein
MADPALYTATQRCSNHRLAYPSPRVILCTTSHGSYWCEIACSDPAPNDTAPEKPQAQCDDLAKRLTYEGANALAYHAGLKVRKDCPVGRCKGIHSWVHIFLKGVNFLDACLPDRDLAIVQRRKTGMLYSKGGCPAPQRSSSLLWHSGWG